MNERDILMNKYRSKSMVIDGHKFPSKKEGRRYQELKMLEKSGVISDLQLQVPYELVPKQGKVKPVKYVADFVYKENGETVVEDVKGIKTQVYKIKSKLMLWRYGIKIRET